MSNERKRTNVNRIAVPLVISVLGLTVLALAFWIVTAAGSGASATEIEPVVIGREDGIGGTGEDGTDGNGQDGTGFAEGDGKVGAGTSSTTSTSSSESVTVPAGVETVEHPVHMRTMDGSTMDPAPSPSPSSTGGYSSGTTQRDESVSPHDGAPRDADGGMMDGAMDDNGAMNDRKTGGSGSGSSGMGSGH